MKTDTKNIKPKYGVFKCLGFMTDLAWNNGERKVIFLCLSQSVLAVVMNLLNLYVTPTILRTVEARESMAKLLITIAFFVLMLMLISASTAYVNNNTLTGRVTVRMMILNLINRKCSTTSYPNLENESFDNLFSKTKRCINDNRASTEAVWNTLSNILKNVIGLIIYTAILTTVDIRMLIFILLTAVIGYIANKKFSGYGYSHREEEGELEKPIYYVSRKVAQDRTFAKDIRIFGLRDWILELQNKSIDALMAFRAKAESVYVWGKVIDLLLAFMRNGVAYAYLITLVLSGKIDVAEFLLYFSAVGGFSGWVSGVLSDALALHRQSLDISTILEFLDFDEPFLFESGKPLVPNLDCEYEIRLENVSFKYPSANDYTLKNINLCLKPKEKLEVVGLNGAGKTTLVKLMCGFLDPTEGRVLLNGVDIRDYNRTDYYKMFSAVYQNYCIIPGSVYLNVSQSCEECDKELVKSCIEKAGLKKKIESLKDGYDSLLNRTVYEEGVELSGGETQRLMLARALYKNAPIIVLDEPTAALDPIAESDIYNRYNEMTLEKSSVYISHRLASTRFCDRIILIGDNGILEEGTHDELLASGGKYAELFEVQRKYYSDSEIQNSLN